MVGRVKWFNDEKGYGFIEYEDLDDIFVHYSVIQMDGFKTLTSGQKVQFKLTSTEKGLQAFDVLKA
jgi:CspA family cold shock protein